MTTLHISKSRMRFIAHSFSSSLVRDASGRTGVAKQGADQYDAYLDPKKVAGSDKLKGVVDLVLKRIEASEGRGRARSATNQRIFARCVEMLVCNLAYLSIKGEGRQVMVPLSNSKLTPKTRPAPFMTEAFAGIAKMIGKSDLGVALLKKGSRADGTLSTLSPGEWLQQLVEREGVDFDDFGVDPDQLASPVLLKGTKVGKKAPVLPLPDNPQVVQILEEMALINDAMEQADIEWVGKNTVDTGSRRLTRIFNNGSFETGGRLFHGFWQALNKEERRAGLRLGGSLLSRRTLLAAEYAWPTLGPALHRVPISICTSCQVLARRGMV